MSKFALELHKDTLCSYQLGLDSAYTPESVIAAYGEAHRIANRLDVNIWGATRLEDLDTLMTDLPRPKHNNQPNGIPDMLACAALRLQDLDRSTEMFTHHVEDYFDDLVSTIRDDGYALEFAAIGLMKGWFESGLFVPDGLSGELVDAVTKVGGELELKNDRI